MYLLEGESSWHVEDWTISQTEGFCRDLKAERLEELVLVFSNAQWDKTKPSYSFRARGEPAQLVYSDVGCWRWKGDITVTRPSDHRYDSFQMRIDDIVLERAFDWMGISTAFAVKGGSGTINFSWRDEDTDEWRCTDGPQSFGLTPANAIGWLTTHNLYIEGPSVRAYRIDGAMSTSAEISYHHFYSETGDSPPYDHPTTSAVGEFWNLSGLGDGDGDPLMLFTDGGTIQGSYFDGYQRYEFNLTAQREP